MFNKKLKKRITALEETVESLEEKIWKLKNPAEYSLKSEVLIEESVSSLTHKTSGMIIGTLIERDYWGEPCRFYRIIEDDTDEIITINEKDIKGYK